MTEDDDLYTDYALQMFSSFMSGDLESTQQMFKSYKDEGKAEDPLFMPGVIYGMIYHLQTLFSSISELTGISEDEVVSNYALAYAGIREELSMNTLFSVKKAREAVSNIDAFRDELIFEDIKQALEKLNLMENRDEIMELFDEMFTEDPDEDI